MSAATTAVTAAQELRAVDLRCEYRRGPSGIDILHPRLSWILESNRRGERQTAFRLLVAGSPDALAEMRGDLWDTGKLVSSQTNQLEYRGLPLKSRTRCHWKVRVWNSEDAPSEWSAPASWSMGLLNMEDWQSRWIGLNENPAGSDKPRPATPRCLRKTFAIDRPVDRATLYATALGLYELRLNGTRAGDDLLTPEWTNYHRRVQYQTHDVTHLIEPGANVLGALLGNGWYCGNWQFWESQLRPIYGDQPCLLAQLEIVFLDGTRETISTDESWRGTTEGPLRFSGIYEGEIFDARRAMPGWDRPGFNDQSWQDVFVAIPVAGSLVWQRSEPIRVTQEIPPIAMTEPKPGVYVFDLGQNMAGWCRLHFAEPAGVEVELRFNEMLNADGTLYLDNLHAGHLSQGDRQVIRYISGGGREMYEPHFTYFGFRYVEVRGLSQRPTLAFLLGRVFHTAFTPAGAFTCANPLLDRLVQNIQWSQRANIMGVPTDCCQRDERCGYSGDMNFFMPTAVYQFDMAAFFHKWLVDLCEDSQYPDGHFGDHAPTYGPGEKWNVGWSDAGIICPWLMYRTYGDTRVIRTHYPAMKRNLEAQIATARGGLRGPENVGIGDWLNLGGGAPNLVIGSAYYAHDLQLMSEMAGVIGEENDSARYAALRREAAGAFADQLVDDAGRIADGSQTAYALAFTMGLVPPAKYEPMRARFAEEIARFDGHLATGFIGTPRLLPGLHAAGRDDLACQLLLDETFPSWLYPVKLGATTIWERWDGWTPGRGFADPAMNSFNHYAFGSVGEYIFGMVGGIEPASPGYRAVRIRPVIGGGLAWAETRYDSIQGRIVSSWKCEGASVAMEVTIPVNSTAEIHVPAANPETVRESGAPAANAPGVEFVRMERGAAVFAVGSGSYRFESVLPL